MWSTTSSPRTELRAAALLALMPALVACVGGGGDGGESPAPERTWDEWSLALRDCPETDGPWRRALAAAAKEQRLDDFGRVAAEVAAERPERWEPAWAAGESFYRQRKVAASNASR